MRQPEICPLCLFKDDVKIGFDFDRHLYVCRCPVCGNFSISEFAVDDRILDAQDNKLAVARAVLSHQVRQATDAGRDWPELLEDWLIAFVANNPALPSIAQQASNVIRYVGDRIRLNGEELEDFPISFGSIVGSISRDFALKIARQLQKQGYLEAELAGGFDSPHELIDVDLTLAGWERYEAEQLGKLSSQYGFLALKFGDAVLDPLVDKVMKPAVKSIGYDLLDMRDVSRAGVIDNLLRMQIRDAAFVLVDLTHDNSGAYWEAGYAEGLGKPVLYICEKGKFEAAKTHFDTNHCTTILWHADEPDQFAGELIATLRRSLDLFTT